MFYVIQVKTGQELLVAGKLKEYGIKACVPLENRIVRSGGFRKQKVYVLFTGYVFLDMEYNTKNYRFIKGIPEVIWFPGDRKNPARLSRLETEWISMLAGKDNTPIGPLIIKQAEDGNWLGGGSRSFTEMQ